MAATKTQTVARGHPEIPPLDFEYLDQAMEFTSSERCTISCGTVCVDPKVRKVVIIFNRRLGIWQLPKGRKNIGEDLHAAALRETYEETGVHARLLPLLVETRSTALPPAHDAPAALSNRLKTKDLITTVATNDSGKKGAIVYDSKLTTDELNNEPIGIIRYPDVQVTTPNTLKTVFFFAAQADSTLPMGDGAQEDHEDLVAEWVAFEVADERLRFKSEKQAVWKVTRDLARTGITA